MSDSGSDSQCILSPHLWPVGTYMYMFVLVNLIKILCLVPWLGKVRWEYELYTAYSEIDAVFHLKNDVVMPYMYNKSLINQACSVKIAWYLLLALFFFCMILDLDCATVTGPSTLTKIIFDHYPFISPSRLVCNPYIQLATDHCQINCTPWQKLSMNCLTSVFLIIIF